MRPYRAIWSLQTVACHLYQEISRNFKGIRDAATPKPFNPPFLQNQFCIEKKKKKQFTKKKIIAKTKKKLSQILICGPPVPSLLNSITWILLACQT